MSDDIGKLDDLVAALKLDRDDQKAREGREKWVRWVSIEIVLLAVCTALATQQHGGFSGRAVRELNQAAIEQGQATNQWAYYQAASIKTHLYKFEKSRRAEAAGAAAEKDDDGAEEKSADGAKAGKPIDEKLGKYERQKATIGDVAKGHEKKRDGHRQTAAIAQDHASRLTLALAILQVAIAIASITVLAKKKGLWAVSIVAGLAGLLQTLNGIFLLM